MVLELNKTYNIDCTEGIKYLPELSGDKQYCIVSDPPFNVGYHYNEYNDKKTDSEYYNWLQGIIGEMPCCIIHYPEALYKLSFKLGKTPTRVVSWVYNSNTPRQHRDAAYFDIKPNFNLVHQPYKNPNDKRIAARIAAGKTGAKSYDWINVNQIKNVSKKSGGGTYHPCQMPVDVMRTIVGIIPENFVIVDPFMGSGTTAVACKYQNRDFIGFELNREYCDLANQRINAIKWTENGQ